MSREYEVILCIVNQGFADSVMSYARDAGAKGGTVLNARGTAKEEVEKEFQITIQPEKEIVMILVEKAIKDAILHAIYKNAGLNSDAHGIAFSLPVDDVVGLGNISEVKE